MLWVLVPYLVAMRCPSCGHEDTRVVDSREAEDGQSIRRRRACDACGERFTTRERSESARIQVLTRDGTREEFDRRKPASAIGKAASKQLAPDAIDRLIENLETTIKQGRAPGPSLTRGRAAFAAPRRSARSSGISTGP